MSDRDISMMGFRASGAAFSGWAVADRAVGEVVKLLGFNTRLLGALDLCLSQLQADAEHLRMKRSPDDRRRADDIDGVVAACRRSIIDVTTE